MENEGEETKEMLERVYRQRDRKKRGMETYLWEDRQRWRLVIGTVGMYCEPFPYLWEDRQRWRLVIGTVGMYCEPS